MKKISFFMFIVLVVILFSTTVIAHSNSPPAINTDENSVNWKSAIADNTASFADVDKITGVNMEADEPPFGLFQKMPDHQMNCNNNEANYLVAYLSKNDGLNFARFDGIAFGEEGSYMRVLKVLNSVECSVMRSELKSKNAGAGDYPLKISITSLYAKTIDMLDKHQS